jgi:hypothetical protein
MRHLIRTLLYLTLPLMLVVDAAVAVEAVVAQVDASGNLVLEFDNVPPEQPQGDIELTYRAGFMDMLLGRYRVTTIQGRRVEAQGVSVSSPPSQGMRVVVTLAQAIPLPLGQDAASPLAPGSTTAQVGKVVAVQGRSAEIEFPVGMTVRPGDRYSLAYQAPRVGRVAIQGTWRVTRVNGNLARAEPEGASGQPRAGQVAIALAPAEAAAPAAQSDGKGSGLFESIADLNTMGFDAYLAEENYKQGMRWLKGDGVVADPAKATEIFRSAAQSGHAGARQQLEALENTAASAAGSGVVERGWIGLALQDLTPDLAKTLGLAAATQGSLVADVSAGGPAEQAGVRPGDMILEFDGQPAIPRRLTEKVRHSAPGSLLRLWIWRGGSRLFLAVRVGKAP